MGVFIGIDRGCSPGVGGVGALRMCLVWPMNHICEVSLKMHLLCSIRLNPPGSSE